MGCNFCKNQKHSLYCLLEESEKSLNYQNLSPGEITKIFQNHMGYPYVLQSSLEQILRDLRLTVPDFKSQNPLSDLYKSFVVQRKKSFNLSRNYPSSKNIKYSPGIKKMSEESYDNDIQYEFKIKNIYLMVILLSTGSPKEKSKYIYDFFINSERRPFVDKEVISAFIKDLIQIVAIQLPVLIYGQKHWYNVTQQITWNEETFAEFRDQNWDLQIIESIFLQKLTENNPNISKNNFVHFIKTQNMDKQKKDWTSSKGIRELFLKGSLKIEKKA